MNYSHQRECILAAVINNPIHPTAEQIYTIAKKQLPDLSLGTVYRNLKLLCKNGMLKKVYVGDDSIHFDGRCDEHCHFICNVCGGIYDLELDKGCELQSLTKNGGGFKAECFEITARGICKNCKKTLDNE